MKSLKSAILLSLIAASAALVGCSKKESGEAAKAAEKPSAGAPAEQTSKESEVRQATYDPDLKPGEIVWDSPEKKKRWEELQKKMQAEGKQ